MEPYISSEAAAAIKFGISSHAHAAMGLPEQLRLPHNFFLRDTEGEILGGALGQLWGAWMYLDYLWVDRSLRGRGHATCLVKAAEDGAVACGCTGAFLGTFSFQARPFYEKLGYHVFGMEKDYPKGHTHYQMTKRLGAWV
jgi:GNAT superfamily N-acetyltransferase